MSSETMSSKEIMEIGLGSIGKIKIIRALAEENKLTTIYLLHKKTHLKREDIRTNVNDLVKIGWVNQSKYATRKLEYRLMLSLFPVATYCRRITYCCRKLRSNLWSFIPTPGAKPKSVSECVSVLCPLW